MSVQKSFIGASPSEPTLARNLYNKPCTKSNGRKKCLSKKIPQAVTLGSLQSTENSEFPEMCWTYQITFLSSTMSQKFTARITDSPNMIQSTIPGRIYKSICTTYGEDL